MEAAVFCQKEEPDGCQYQGGAEEGEEGEDAAVVDGAGVEGAAAGLELGLVGVGVLVEGRGGGGGAGGEREGDGVCACAEGFDENWGSHHNDIVKVRGGKCSGRSTLWMALAPVTAGFMRLMRSKKCRIQSTLCKSQLFSG